MRAVFFLLLLGLAAASRFLSRYEVAGESMLPAYQAGDRLIAQSLSYLLRPPRIGEAVVVIQPGSDGRKDLKRIAAGPGSSVNILGEERTLGADEWFVLGDNRKASTDSRTLGPVRRQEIVARVWFQY